MMHSNISIALNQLVTILSVATNSQMHVRLLGWFIIAYDEFIWIFLKFLKGNRFLKKTDLEIMLLRGFSENDYKLE